jgi:hypothetical protein
MAPAADMNEIPISTSLAATASATIRKPRTRPGNLESITESKASTLPRVGNETELLEFANSDGTGDWSPKKVQKGQINALAKMLFALRRSEKLA